MRTIILALVMALAGCGEAVGAGQSSRPEATPTALPAEAVLLPDTARIAILQQCSRSTPEPGEAGWRPDAADVAMLEAAVAAALRQRRNASDPDWSRFPNGWRRQYVGIVRGGRHYLYGNIYPRDADRYASDPRRWQREPVAVCDGGPAFFGVEYDVDARRITHLAFNGMA